MLNRVGSKGCGPSANLQQVARAPKQYEGYRRASEKEAEFIRSRIRAIASGSVPDNTSGANQYRANYIGHGGAGRWNGGRPVRSVGGNTFAYDPSVPNGPYAPYETPKDVAATPSDTNAYTAPGAGKPSSFGGQKFTDYFATPAEAATPKLKENMTPAEINAWNAAHGGVAAGNAWQKALHTLSRPHEHAKRLLQHISANVPNVGAATASHVANHHHGPVNSHNTASHEVKVGNVNVHMAPGSDASAIVRDIKPALERASFASLGNYSLA